MSKFAFILGAAALGWSGLDNDSTASVITAVLLFVFSFSD